MSTACVSCSVMFFMGIAALNPDKDPVKEKAHQCPQQLGKIGLCESREHVFPQRIRR